MEILFLVFYFAFMLLLYMAFVISAFHQVDSKSGLKRVFYLVLSALVLALVVINPLLMVPHINNTAAIFLSLFHLLYFIVIGYVIYRVKHIQIRE